MKILNENKTPNVEDKAAFIKLRVDAVEMALRSQLGWQDVSTLVVGIGKNGDKYDINTIITRGDSMNAPLFLNNLMIALVNTLPQFAVQGKENQLLQEFGMALAAHGMKGEVPNAHQ